MKIEQLEEVLDDLLFSMIITYFEDSELEWEEWEGKSASADLKLDADECIEFDLMLAIGRCVRNLDMSGSDIGLTIRPNDNKLILYYED